MIVTRDTNFCRVFELPETYPSDYCFGGGHPVTFRMVDWFNPVPPDASHGVLVDWQDGKCEMTAEQNEELRGFLSDFLMQKHYVKADRRYLVLTDYGDAFVVQP